MDDELYTFTAPSNDTVLTIQSTLEDGMLVDSFQLIQNPVPEPGQLLSAGGITGQTGGRERLGDWKLEVLDNRAGATNPAPILVSWELSLVVDRVVPAAIPLAGFVPNTNSVFAGDISYYYVDCAAWAKFATNILITTTGPLNLLFSQGQEPTGANPPDDVTWRRPSTQE